VDAELSHTGEVVAATESLIAATRVLADIVNPGAPGSAQDEYGTASAVLAGEALVFSAFDELTRAELPPGFVVAVTRTLARAGLDSCRGLAEEVELRGVVDCAPERYLAVARLKTASLFRGVCETGAIIGGADSATTGALLRYAGHLGLAFQLHDDLAPYRHDSAFNNAGISDFANRRLTFPLLVAYQLAGTDDRQRLRSVLSGQLPPGYARQIAGEIAGATGALDVARATVQDEVDRARQCLDALPGNPGVANLVILAGRCLAG
jgi:geranylgeranyl diphosphate synthase type I